MMHTRTFLKTACHIVTTVNCNEINQILKHIFLIYVCINRLKLNFQYQVLMTGLRT